MTKEIEQILVSKVVWDDARKKYMDLVIKHNDLNQKVTERQNEIMQEALNYLFNQLIWKNHHYIYKDFMRFYNKEISEHIRNFSYERIKIKKRSKE